MTDPLLTRIAQTLRTHRLLPKGSRVLVAVSGGADSVALLEALVALNASGLRHLQIAHLDHQLRPSSPEDAEFVRALAARHQLPFHLERADVRAACAAHHWSLEDGARRVRHERLQALAERYHAPVIALAHTADDQAETVLLRLLRGTGLRGLGAMEYSRPAGEALLIRPLLDITRREVVSFLERRNAAFREDPSNSDWRFTRNRIRHQLLPLLEEHYNPNIRQGLLQLAIQSRGDYAYLAHMAQRHWKRTVKLSAGREAVVALKPFRRHPAALQRQLLRQVIERLRGEPALVEFRHWLLAERLIAEAPPGAVLDLPGGIQLTKQADRLLCRRLE
jgi:tRNA(Ile)-lysidine synthase